MDDKSSDDKLDLAPVLYVSLYEVFEPTVTTFSDSSSTSDAENVSDNLV